MGLIDGRFITNASVGNAKIDDDAVDSTKLAADAIDSNGLLGVDVFDSEHYTDGSIDGVHLENNVPNDILDNKVIGSISRFNSVVVSSANNVSVTDTVFQAIKGLGGVPAMRYATSSTDVEPAVVCIPDNSDHVEVIKTSDGQKIIESGDEVYGALARSFVTSLPSATTTFTNGSTAVTGAGFVANLSVGDYITVDPNALKFVGKVASITDDNNLVLEDNWAGPNISANVIVRVIEIRVNFFRNFSGSEVATTVNDTVDVFVPFQLEFTDTPFGGFAHNIYPAEGHISAHTHDDLYFTETELGDTDATDGGALIGYDSSSNTLSSATNISNAIDDIAGNVSGLSGDFTVEELAIGSTIAPGAAIGTLSSTPEDVNEVALFVNGIKYKNGAADGFSVSGTTVTWGASAPFSLETTDVVEAHYYV